MRSGLRKLFHLLAAAALTVLAVTACTRVGDDENVGSAQALAVVHDANFTDAVFVSGLSGPTAMTFAPDGRLFVSEKDGKLRVIKDNQLLPTPFVTLTVDRDNERGLMGVAFDPDFENNHYLYVFYTSTEGSIHNRLSRFTAAGDVAVPGSEVVLADFPTLGAANHNGGAVHFGADGKLYVALGDNAVGQNAQSLSTPFGKLLRFNADGTSPTDNPFYNSTTGLNRAIWALGLRNPFTFAIQPGTGAIFINDVGNGGWEEINRGQAGANYGWPATEGNFPGHPEFVAPFFTYPHGEGTSNGNCIAGGTFYNPPIPAFPAAYVGQYFYADFTNNWIHRIDPTSGADSLFATGVNGPVDLDIGPDGALYYLARGSGQVGRIAYTASLPPSVVQQPSDALVSVGYDATFTVSSTGEPPLSYQWQRNGVNISGATSASYTLSNAQISDSGARFRAVVTNGVGSTTSREAVLTVTTNRPPVATITTPASGATFTGGSTLSFAGTGTDNEDGALPASAYSWLIVFHHDTHFHPGMPETSGVTSGSWSIPNAGEISDNVWYRVYLKVTDSIGLTHTTFRDVHPVKTPITIATNPPGLQITLDGQPFTAPYATIGVAGILRSLGVASPQRANNKYWAFSSWSDGGAETHTITTPSTATTYTAQFVETTLPPCGSNSLTAVAATSSSNENDGLGPLNAIDGNTSTRWASSSSDPQWISVDLGATRHISRVVLSWENASSRDYSIEVSDSATGPWTTLYTDPAGNGGVDDIRDLNGTGRYVRVYGRSRNSAYGHSLWEIQVFGDATPYCDPGGSHAVCGNNVVEAGEQCDDGNTVDTDACTNACQTPTCSDSIQNQGEAGVDCGGPCTACGSCASNALTRVSAVSSSNENAGMSAANAIDGSLGTRWASAFSDPQWIYVDLGASRHINRVVLRWENAASASYRLEAATSPEGPWTTLHTDPAGNGGVDDIGSLSGAGRYVRMYSTARTTGYGNSLFEFEVYGDNNPSCGSGETL